MLQTKHKVSTTRLPFGFGCFFRFRCLRVQGLGCSGFQCSVFGIFGGLGFQVEVVLHVGYVSTVAFPFLTFLVSGFEVFSASGFSGCKPEKKRKKGKKHARLPQQLGRPTHKTWASLGTASNTNTSNSNCCVGCTRVLSDEPSAGITRLSAGVRKSA